MVDLGGIRILNRFRVGARDGACGDGVIRALLQNVSRLLSIPKERATYPTLYETTFVHAADAVSDLLLVYSLSQQFAGTSVANR